MSATASFGKRLGKQYFSSTGAWPVQLLGSPALRVMCKAVDGEALIEEKTALVATLAAFRAEHGFGRGIAAPQIGVTRRFVAVNLGGSGNSSGGGGDNGSDEIRSSSVSREMEKTRVLADPRIVWRSAATMTLWDDCMSLPWVLCKVRRNRSISVEFENEVGETELWAQLPASTSELLQHELDHLDGILITDRMLECSNVGSDRDDPMVQTIVSREEYESNRAEFDRQVDSTIVPVPAL